MNEKQLMKISAVGIIICFIILYLISIQDLSVDVKIGDIDRSYIGKTVDLTGEINNIFTNNGDVFFDIEDETGSIKVVLWEDTLDLLRMKNVNVSEMENGKSINIQGEVQVYKGELEVLPIHGNVKLM